MKYSVKPHRKDDLDVKSVDVIERAESRRFLTRSIFFISSTALVAAGAYGAVVGDFAPARDVWAFVGPIFGAILQYYYGKQNE